MCSRLSQLNSLKTLAPAHPKKSHCIKPLHILHFWPKKLKTLVPAQKGRSAASRPGENVCDRATSVGSTRPIRAHAASPRPPARTHDTNTKRNRNRFPDWVNPLNLRQEDVNFCMWHSASKAKLRWGAKQSSVNAVSICLLQSWNSFLLILSQIKTWLFFWNEVFSFLNFHLIILNSVQSWHSNHNFWIIADLFPKGRLNFDFTEECFAPCWSIFWCYTWLYVSISF